MAEWIEKRMEDVAFFNPRESLKKGCVAKKVAMDKLQPFCRDVPNFEMESFSGGTKFRNNDTIMARITPCLENGKTALIIRGCPACFLILKGVVISSHETNRFS